MKECQNCGSRVTLQFARVYGNNDDDVFACMKCVEPGEGGRSILRNGGAAIPNATG